MIITTPLEAYIQALPKTIRDSLQIVERDQIFDGMLLHISDDNDPDPFIPRIGSRQMKVEDRTIPRICCAPTILGCMIGHQATLKSFMSKTTAHHTENGIHNPDNYFGGHKIYTFDFDYAIKPGTSLVPDRDISDEYWLVLGGVKNSTYTPIEVGTFFYNTITVRNSMPGMHYHTVIHYEVTREGGLQFSHDIRLNKGCWEIIGPDPYCDLGKPWDKYKDFKAREITKAEYDREKTRSAALLSRSGNEPPVFTKW